MNQRQQLIRAMLAGGLAAVAGCKPGTTAPSEPPTNHQAAVKLERAKQETREAVSAARDYAYAQRAEFADHVRAELAALNQELTNLSGQAGQTKDAVQAELEPRLQALRTKLAGVGERIDQLKAASEPKWEELKTNLNAAYVDAKQSVHEARQWLSEKLAPKQ